MGMAVNNVLVEDESRRKLRELVADPIVVDPLLRLAEADETYACLRFVDPYGDTIFNRGQAEQLVFELERLARHATTHQQQSVLTELRSLAVFCSEEPHRFLRFEGD